MYIVLSLLESPYARKMPHKVVSGPDYDDDYDEYDDDDDDEYDETRYGNNTPVMTGKGILPNLLALFISSIKRGKWSLELLYTPSHTIENVPVFSQRLFNCSDQCLSS
jgi:hypothetical protein